MVAKNINIDNLTITKKYSISCEEVISFDVTEVATFEPNEKSKNTNQFYFFSYAVSF